MKFESLTETPAQAARPFKWTRGVLGAAAALMVAACGTTPGAEEASFEGTTKTGDSNVGEVAFDLQVDGAVVQTVHYEVQGGSFDKTGVIDVSSAPRVSAVVGGIPFGTGYSATLSADSSGGTALHCSGSTTFDISSPGTTPVAVHMACQETAAAVPVPRGASAGLFALLLGAGIFLVTRRRSPDA